MAATPPEKDKPTELEAAAAAEQEKVEAAVTRTDDDAAELTERDEGTLEARELELKRQASVERAVDKANAKELPAIGGPLKNPGLGR